MLWEFVTTPGRRVAWQAGVTGVEVTAKGNRRGVGATNHCLHGKGASIEELLDWRPYDYFTIRNTVPTPVGALHFLQTTEFEPTATGTTLHLRIAPPATRKERVIAKLMMPMLDRSLRTSDARLVEQLEAALDGRARDAAKEPRVPQVGAGGSAQGSSDA